MNAIDLLKNQHRQVEEAFERIETAEDSEERLGLFAELADSFMIHSAIEEQIFYPAVFAERTEEELREAVEEHLQAKRMIADLLELDPEDEQWVAKCTVLKEEIEHHVSEEENELFPVVEEEFTKKRLNEFGTEMFELAKDLEEEGAPRERVYEETDEAVLQF